LRDGDRDRLSVLTRSSAVRAGLGWAACLIGHYELFGQYARPRMQSYFATRERVALAVTGFAVVACALVTAVQH
jgi:hypothetical protein